jgi:hypothetical protein
MKLAEKPISSNCLKDSAWGAYTRRRYKATKATKVIPRGSRFMDRPANKNKKNLGLTRKHQFGCPKCSFSSFEVLRFAGRFEDHNPDRTE